MVASLIAPHATHCTALAPLAAILLDLLLTHLPRHVHPTAAPLTYVLHTCSLSGGNFDAAAAASARHLPVESAMPGTTLGLIPLQAFESGGTLYGAAALFATVYPVFRV